MHSSEQYAHAERVVADFEAGVYDERLGIAPDERSVLAKARNGDRLSLAEFRTLMALGEYELADKAHNDNRLDFTQER